MICNNLDYKIQANTLELESDLARIEGDICNLYNQVA